MTRDEIASLVAAEDRDTPLSPLIRKLERALLAGRGIRLSAKEMDVLVVAGLYDIVSAAEAKAIKEQAARRLGLVREEVEPKPRAGQPAPKDPPRAYSPASLAERWSCSAQLVRNLIKQGKLRHFMHGNMYRIRPEEVERFEQAGGTGNDSVATDSA